MRPLLLLFAALLPALRAQAPAAPQALPENRSRTNESFFRKLENLPTPNVYRAASGAPGHRYWQQQVDYRIKVALDDATQTVRGTQEITYHNNAPDELRYLWLQLDQNIRRAASTAASSRSAPNLAAQAGDDKPGVSTFALRGLESRDNREGHRIQAVKDAQGRDLPFTVVDTMMRVDLPAPLKPGQVFRFTVAWSYQVNNYKHAGGRGGFEQLEDGARLYNLAQWQPRLVAYTDDMGWQHQQFLGQGEFTLEFGDWDVEITVPWDFTVLATGELQNPGEVLTAAQRERLAKARSSARPVFIVAPDEAGKPESRPMASGTATWKFKASNVRDFAWNTCRRQIWDAQGVDVNGRTVLAMSGYTKEGMPLWDRYSTAAVAHTLRVYGRYTFDYPYPVAISCLGLGGGGGMEYPMLCFNGPRPEKDGTYSERTKLGLVGVIIHEVGHNFFPMIVNSDERQWSWMDEGLNTFLQYLAEKEWDPDFPVTRSIVQGITDYLKFPDATPIMTQSDAVRHFGANAYQKPAAGLNMLRETIMGRELFDFAFKEYARRWKFKRPQPADFFRTMNDASGLDLDWFWRGWFFMTLAPDLAVENVEWFRIADGDPAKARARQKEADARRDQNASKLRDRDLIPPGGVEKQLGLQDFYTDGSWDRYGVTPADLQKFEALRKAQGEDEKAWRGYTKNLYRITFRNVGRFPMPILARLEFKDGSSELLRLPAQAWLQNEERFSRLVATEKELAGVELDPLFEIPDVDRGNDTWARRIGPVQMLNLAPQPPRGSNPMQAAKAAAKKAEGGKVEAKKPESAP